jgi:Family of unknown function (DUF6111)
MIRPVFTELALFLAPFAIYAVFLWATRAGVLDPEHWSIGRMAWLLIASLTLMIGSFVVLAQFGGAPPNSKYMPAHVENGVLVPGREQ